MFKNKPENKLDHVWHEDIGLVMCLLQAEWLTPIWSKQEFFITRYRPWGYTQTTCASKKKNTGKNTTP